MKEELLEIKQQKNDILSVGAKGGAIAFGLRIASVSLGFFNQILLARTLGAEGIGAVLLTLSVVNISGQFARFGMEDAMMRFIPDYIEKRDYARLKGTIYFVLTFCFLLSVLFVFVVLQLSEFLSLKVFHSAGLLTLLPVVVVAIPLNVIRGVIGGVLKGYKDTFKALLPETLVLPLLRIVVFLLLILKGVSPLYAIIAFIAGEFFALILSIVFLTGKLRRIKKIKPQSENKKVLSIASTMIITGLSIFLFTQADLWILAMFTSTEVVGIYGVSARLVTLAAFSLMAFSTIIPPLISSAHTSGNHVELKRIISGSSRWILSIAMPIILLIVLEGKFILKYVYGDTFIMGYTVLIILSVGQLINAASGLVGYVLKMTGEHKTFMYITVTCGILNIILNILLVPHFGAVGAAVSTAFTLSMVNIISVFVVYKRFLVLSFAKGLTFDIVFASIVGIFYFLCIYSNFHFGIHILLLSALTVYIWKSIVNNDFPLKSVFSGSWNNPLSHISR